VDDSEPLAQQDTSSREECVLDVSLLVPGFVAAVAAAHLH
jgi:hypothetical protein